MQQKAKKETYYGKKVLVNPTTESLRRDECLCLNCDKLKPVGNCPVAQALYEICVKENVALMITRCPLFGHKD